MTEVGLTRRRAKRRVAPLWLPCGRREEAKRRPNGRGGGFSGAPSDAEAARVYRNDKGNERKLSTLGFAGGLAARIRAATGERKCAA